MIIKLPSFLIKSSTVEFIREALRTPNISFYDWLHGNVYSRWPYLYISIGTGEHPIVKIYGPFIKQFLRLLKPRSLVINPEELDELSPTENGSKLYTFADSYHGKVVRLDSAYQLVTIKEDIRLPDLEHVIPYRKARDIILKNPNHIVVLDCPCRASRSEPCLPLDVCLIVGEPFASLVAQNHPQKSRWITQEEAVQILQEEEQRGHVHHAFFKDAMLGRFYAICNCCSCCCGAMQAHRNGTPMLTSSGYVAFVDESICIACGTCAYNCQFGAINVSNGYAVVDPTQCMGCGVCSTLCEQSAVTLTLDPTKGDPLIIRQLLENVIVQSPGNEI